MELTNYRDWIAPELERSELWRPHVDLRRVEVLKPRRTASGYSIASYVNLEEVPQVQKGWSEASWVQRPFGWSEARVARDSLDPAPYEALEHLRRYLLNLESDEKSWVGATAAPELHNLYRSASGYLPNLPSVLALYRAPEGGQASLAAAKISGASWGTPAARRQAFYRVSPRNPKSEPFFLLHVGELEKDGSDSRNSQNDVAFPAPGDRI